jgi:hypothetical protein
MELLVGFGIGLIVGWVALPCPQFVKDFWTKIFGGNTTA